MQILVTSDTLGKNIQGLSKMMNGKASLAILDHYLFEVDGNVLQIKSKSIYNTSPLNALSTVWNVTLPL